MQKAAGQERQGQGPRRPDRRAERMSGGRRPAGRAPAKPWDQWTPEERRQIDKFTEEHFPEMYVDLKRLGERRPEMYQRRMQRIAPEMRRLMMTASENPQKGSLMIRERQVEMQIHGLARRYHAAENGDAPRETVRATLVELVGQLFDLQRERRELDVKEMEARLAGLRARLAEQERVREDLIQRRVEEILERPPMRTRSAQEEHD